MSEIPLVMIVDDYPDAREMYSEYLTFAGYRVVEAANGVEAIEKAEALLPSVILMDLSMPVMDGWEATRRLKAASKTRRIPVIALTGHALDGNSEEARKAGCDGFIAKPCLPQDLLAKLQEVIGSPPAVSRASSRASASRKGSARGSGQGRSRPTSRARVSRKH